MDQAEGEGVTGRRYDVPGAGMTSAGWFTGYFRDAATGLDYADQRYHQPGMGRFMTPDAAPSVNLADPNSWNRYAYVQGDPVNYNDPTGQVISCPACSIYQSVNTTVMMSFGVDPSWGYLAGIVAQAQATAALAVQTWQQATVAAAVSGAVSRLSSPSCNSLFGNEDDPGAVLQGAFNNGMIRALPFGGDINPGTLAQTAGNMIQIGSNRGFFTGEIWVPSNTPNSDPRGVPTNGYVSVPLSSTADFSGLSQSDSQQLILIHELLHLMGVVGSDTSNEQITLPNGQTVTGSSGVTQAVRKACF